MPVTLHLIDAGPPPQFFLVGSALTTACCCGEGDFPGEGWYCVEIQVGGDCESLSCASRDCYQILTATAWAFWLFDECWYDDGVSMWTLATVISGPHATEGECNLVCTGCP